MAISFNNGTVLTSGGGSSNLLVNADGDAVLAGIPLINQGRRHYYVDAVGGSDSNDGLTSGTAYKTIQYAVDQIADINEVAIQPNLFHNIIHVASGTYGEEVRILSKEFNGSTSNLLLLIEGTREIIATGTVSSYGVIDPDSGRNTGLHNITASLNNSYGVNQLKGYNFEMETDNYSYGVRGIIAGNSGSTIYVVYSSMLPSLSNRYFYLSSSIAATTGSVKIYKPTTVISGGIYAAGNNGTIVLKNLDFMSTPGTSSTYGPLANFSVGRMSAESDLTVPALSYYENRHFTSSITGASPSTLLSYNNDTLVAVACRFQIGNNINQTQLPSNSRILDSYFYATGSGSKTLSNSLMAPSKILAIEGCYLTGCSVSLSDLGGIGSLNYSYVEDGNVTFSSVTSPRAPLKMKWNPASSSSYTYGNLTFASTRLSSDYPLTSDLTTIRLALTDSSVIVGTTAWTGPFNYRAIDLVANSSLFLNSSTAYISGVMNGADNLILVAGNSIFYKLGGSMSFDVDLNSRRYSTLKPSFSVQGGKVYFNVNPTYTATSVTSSQSDITLDDVPFKYSDLPASNFFSIAHSSENINNNYIKYNINPFGNSQGIGGTANSQFELGSTEGRKVIQVTSTSLNLATLGKSSHASNIFCDIQSAGNCTITLPIISGSSAVSSSLHRQYTIKNYSGNRTVTLSSSNGDFIETNTIAASGTLRIHALSSSARGYGWYEI